MTGLELFRCKSQVKNTSSEAPNTDNVTNPGQADIFSYSCQLAPLASAGCASPTYPNDCSASDSPLLFSDMLCLLERQRRRRASSGLPADPALSCGMCRGKILHTRNQHLRNHSGFSVACSNACSVACSNGISLVNGVFQRIVTFPVDFHWNCPNGFSVAFSNGIPLL